eukprot:3415359-Rhodomonas_salina.5
MEAGLRRQARGRSARSLPCSPHAAPAVLIAPAVSGDGSEVSGEGFGECGFVGTGANKRAWPWRAGLRRRKDGKGRMDVRAGTHVDSDLGHAERLALLARLHAPRILDAVRLEFKRVSPGAPLRKRSCHTFRWPEDPRK